MAKTVNEVFRDHVRYTGDGLPNAPVGRPLPIGDPSSGVHNPPKADIREALGGVYEAAEQAAASAASATGTPQFLNRQTAGSAAIPVHAGQIIVGGVIYERDPNGTALQTGDGAKWTPLGELAPQYYGDASVANTAMQASLTANRGSVRIPKGDYTVDGTAYSIDHEALIFKSSALAVNLFGQARNNQILCVMDTPDDPVLDGAHSRVPINVTVRAFGGQHASGVRSNLINNSTDGNGCTAFYGHIQTFPQTGWSAALHGESRHGGGTSMCLSVEAASFGTAGSFYGAVISNTTNNPNVKHNSGGNPVAHPSATGIHIHGTGGDAGNLHRGSWAYGIDFTPTSIRPGGTDIRMRSPAFNHLHVTAAAQATGADILLEANSANGLALRGTYATAAISLPAGQKIALDATGSVAIRYNPTLNRIEFLNGTDGKGYLDMTATGTNAKLN